MKKKILAALAAATVSMMSFVSLVSAEQAKAEEYRQMFKSGNFYVEYNVNNKFNDFNNTDMNRIRKSFMERDSFMIIAAQNGNIIKSSIKKSRGLIANPFKSNKSVPDILYKDGKFYRFFKFEYGFGGPTLLKGIAKKGKTTLGMVLPENLIQSPDLSPDEEWQYIKSDLSLPEELAIFCWNSKYNDNQMNMPAPQYSGSSKRTIKDKDYDCDQYVNYITDLTNTNIATEAYNMLYDNGQLVMIQKYFIRNGKETLLREVSINNITSQVPESAFTIKSKIKIYEHGKGDMSDLLEQPILVETLGGKISDK